MIILDLNGVLAEKTFIGKGVVPKGSYKVNGSFYKILPEVKTFITNLFKEYKVAIFSSTTKRNAIPLIKEIFTKWQRKNLLFIWTRDRTTIDLEDLKRYKTIKNISNFWDNPVLNSKCYYTKYNTIILDDELEKQRINPRECVIIFDIKSDEANFETLLDTIKKRLMTNSMTTLEL